MCWRKAWEMKLCRACQRKFGRKISRAMATPAQNQRVAKKRRAGVRTMPPRIAAM